MRFFFAVLFSCLSSMASAVDLDFNQVPVSQFAYAVVKGMLKQDYVISADAANVDTKVTISVHGLDDDGIRAVLADVLKGVGLQAIERRGIFYLEKRSASTIEKEMPVIEKTPGEKADITKSDLIPLAADEDVQIYFPKYRGSDYLQLAVRAAGCRSMDAAIRSQQMGQYGQVGAGYGTANNYTGQSQYLAQNQVVQAATQQYGQVQTGATNTVTANLWKDVLVYTGKPSCMSKVERLLSQLDRPSVAVELRGAILEVTDSKENVRSLQAVLGLLAGRVKFAIDAGTAAANSVTLKSVTLSSVLSAVDGDTRFRSISEPSLRVVEGETAKLTIGQDVPVRGAITTTSSGTSVQSVEYKTAGLVFEVTPTVYQDVLRLKIGHQISSFTTTTTSGIDSPTKITREASTVVQANDGELIAIGGLDESKETKSVSGLGFLPSFMRSKADSSSKSQIILLLEVKKQPNMPI